ncbi:septal ring lytic transglycosylase RlpA family protein [Dechloromonas agitata]|uniref:septal ring lytic transglycosylase RlpA family protein n=1 Tax=Dechloromonas agitata TaxID=73030 RepID=UPI0004820224|nr:septal ring lytic transglycosylase RlpA family protein [Dechloromonas agitata]MDE1546687.1 septal ring lytic transglycosylase RlpA family protein [Dechloromonas agitata]
MIRLALAASFAVLLAACGGPGPLREPAAEPGKGEAARTPTPTKKPTAVLKRGGGFYKDDGPADDIPDGLDDIPDAEPKWEPLHKPATRPYVVLGKEYVPNTSVKPYRTRGIASWYGKKFHGQKTSIGEPYDMFAMTAAHTTLALPSYARVTNVQTGKSVVVRITDRGPFHADRVIDLSYTAAYKLGLINGGSGLVEVEAIIPGETTTTAYAQVSPPPRPIATETDDIEQLARRMAQEERPVQTATMAGMSGDAATQKGVYLQLGAFSSAENAENLKSHLQRELDWLSEPMQVNAGGGIHRLHLGPYASRSEAEKMAEKIRLALGYRPTFVTR